MPANGTVEWMCDVTGEIVYDWDNYVLFHEGDISVVRDNGVDYVIVTEYFFNFSTGYDDSHNEYFYAASVVQCFTW